MDWHSRERLAAAGAGAAFGAILLFCGAATAHTGHLSPAAALADRPIASVVAPLAQAGEEDQTPGWVSPVETGVGVIIGGVLTLSVPR
jgi:hypothetical protein